MIDDKLSVTLLHINCKRIFEKRVDRPWAET